MTTYNKPFLTFEEQVNLLEKRGVIISDRAEALSFLSKVSYYKFGGYTLFFEAKGTSSQRSSIYPHNTEFKEIIALYEFDRELRNLMWEALSKIEIAVKTNITHILTSVKSASQGAFVLYDTSLFSNKDKQDVILDKIWKAVFKNKAEKYIDHYCKKYCEKSCINRTAQKSNNDPKDCSEKIPLWMASEVMTFGNISVLFKYLNTDTRNDISKPLGIDGYYYTSWLHTCSVVRNICAHHGRLFNRNNMVFPKKLDKPWHVVKSNTFFAILCCVKEMMRFHKIDSAEWKQKIENLIKTANFRDKNISMGLFDGWEQTALWKR
ncbi:MAG: Abi family protein [Elusimicrobiota bacterium]|jgi:abortive infection bacteriophage resistance protein|nr:Abi family protein [Elusimicrobiota bacterium]